MLSDRANAICLLDILKEYSDPEHILPMREILSKMQAVYGLKPDRRTIYSAVAALAELGYDISPYEENGVGYYLRSRELEQPEVLLLTDAVYSFPFISARQSEQLIGKLQKQLSIHQRKKYRHLTVTRQERKTDNRQVFWNIEILDEAITRRKKVRYTHLRYGLDKHQHAGKSHVISPCGMVYMNEHYYLICLPDQVDNTSLYRIDRMRDIEILEEDSAAPKADRAYVQDAIYAYSGAPEQITMHCDKKIINDVIDRFGTDIQLRELDEGRFSVTIIAPPRGIRFWALQYLDFVEVVQPTWLREQIVESLRNNKYKKEGHENER